MSFGKPFSEIFSKRTSTSDFLNPYRFQNYSLSAKSVEILNPEVNSAIIIGVTPV